MKCLFVLLGLCAIGAVFGQLNFHSSSRSSSIRDADRRDPFGGKFFEAGHEYAFDFDMQYDSGMSGSVDEHSFTRMSGKLTFVYGSHGRNTFKLTNVKLGKANKHVVGMDILPMSAFEHVPLDSKQVELLELPFSVNEESGILSDVIFDKRDSTWSKNLKRATLSSGQVNMKLIDEMGDFYNEGSIDMKHQTSEETIEGKCDVHYTRKLQNEGSVTFNVTKTIDYSSCTNTKDLRYNYRFASTCSTCKEESDEDKKEVAQNIDSTARSTVINMVLHGSAQKFLLHQVEVVSMYVTPFVVTQQETELTTFVRARWTIVSVSKESRRSHHIREEGPVESLVYSVDWDVTEEKFYMQGDRAFGNDGTPFAYMKNKASELVKLLEHIIDHSKIKESGMTMQSTEYFDRAVRLVRMMTKKELESVEKSVRRQSELAELFMNVVTSGSTMNTIDYFVEKVLSGDVKPMEATLSMKKFINVMYPSDEQVQKVLKLCKSSLAKERKNWYLRQSCYLTVSTMMNALCKRSRDRLATNLDKHHFTSCDRELKQSYLRDIREISKDSRNLFDQMLHMQTLQNAALDISIHDLENVIKDRSLDKLHRSAAIEALRHLDVSGRKVQRILLPVFINHNEPAVVRMSAFHIIMHTYPERDILSTIVITITKERKSPFTAFVLDCLSSFRLSKNPCLKKISTELSSLLSVVNVDVYATKDFGGKMNGIDYYSDNTKTGFFLYHYSLAKEDVLYKKSLIGLDSVFSGHWHNDIFQLGVIDGNRKVEKLMQKVVNFVKDNVLSMKTQETRTRGSRSTDSPRDLLKQLINVLKISGREHKDKTTSILLLRFKNFEQLALPLDFDLLDDMIKELSRTLTLRSSHPVGFKVNFASNLYETMTKMPTSLGLPLIISSKLPMLAFIKGDAEFFGRALKVRTHFTTTQTHVAYSEIWTPFMSNGVQSLKSMEFNAPLTMTFEYSTIEKLTLKMSYQIPEKSQNILALRTVPSTFVKLNSADLEGELEKMTMVNRNYRHTIHAISKNIGRTADTGCPLVLRQKGYDIFALDKPVEVLLSGENYFLVVLEPHPNAPEKYDFTIEVERDNSARMSSPSLENFYSSRKQEKFFAVDDLSTREEKSRRDAFEYSVSSWRSSDKVTMWRVAVDAQSRGSSIERKARAEMTYACDQNYCKVTMDARRSPVKELNEEYEWKMNMNYEHMAVWPEASLRKHHEKSVQQVVGQLKMTWGEQRSEEQFINMKIQGEVDKDTRELLRLHKGRRSSDMTPLERRALLQKATEFNVFKYFVTHKVSKDVKTFFVDYLTYFRYANWYRTETNNTNTVALAENELSAMMTVDNDMGRFVNVTVETPKKTVKFFEIELPVSYAMYGKHEKQQKRGNVVSRNSCIIDKDRVKSFSRKHFSVPMWASDCYTLLAKDCSKLETGETPRFAVLTKQRSKRSQYKNLRLVLEDMIIDVEKDNYDGLVVRINDDLVRDDQRLSRLGIDLSEDVFDFENSDIHVLFDGRRIKIRISPLLDSVHCGLCDNYNADDEYELSLPNSDKAENLWDFHEAYVVKTRECRMENNEIRRPSNYDLDLDDKENWLEETKSTRREMFF